MLPHQSTSKFISFASVIKLILKVEKTREIKNKNSLGISDFEVQYVQWFEVNWFWCKTCSAQRTKQMFVKMVDANKQRNLIFNFVCF